MVSSWKGICLAVWTIMAIAMAQPSCGQTIPGLDGEPPRPAYNVQDNAGLFARNQEQLKVISDRLYALSQKYHFHIYVVIESAVIGSTPIELSAQLQKAWLPDGNGFAIVYEADSRSFGIGRSFDKEPAEGAMIPSYVTADIVEKVRKQLASEVAAAPMDRETLLDRWTFLLTKECEAYFTKTQAPDNVKRETLKLGIATVGVVSFFALLGLLGARFFRKREEHQSRAFSFPVTPDQQRLGAPFGAKVSSRRFGGPAGS